MAEKKLKKDVDYAQIVENVLNENEWRFNVKKTEKVTIFSLPMSAKNCPVLNLRLNVFAIGSSQLRCYLAEGTKKSQRAALLDVLNNLNNRYRYITLSVDSDGDIVAAYDFNLAGEDESVIGKQIVTLVYLVSEVMDKCIPPIMKTIWNGEDDEDEEE